MHSPSTPFKMIKLPITDISTRLQSNTLLKKISGTVDDPFDPLRLNWRYFNLLQSQIRDKHFSKDVIANIAFMFIPFAFAMFTTIWNLVIVISLNDLKGLVENLSHTVVTAASLYNHYVILWQNGSFERLTEDLRAINRRCFTEDQCRLVELCGQFVTNSFFFYVFFGSILFSTVPLMTRSQCTSTELYICGLITPGTFAYDATSTPYFELTYMYQMYMTFIGTALLVAPTAFCLAVIVHIIAHLDFIKNKLRCSTENSMNGENVQVLDDVIEHHVAVLRIGAETIELSNSVMIMPLVASLQISVLIFTIVLMITEKDSKFDLNVTRVAMHAFGWVATTFLISFASEILAEKSLEVSSVAYNVEWFNENKSFQKNLLLVMVRGQKACSLKVLSMKNISLQTFSGTMRTAYSIFNLFYSSRRRQN